MTTVQLAIGLLTLLTNAFFVGAEFALISVRRSQIEPQAVQGSRRARSTLWGLEHLSAAMATAQLGITISSLVLGAPSPYSAIARTPEAVGEAGALRLRLRAGRPTVLGLLLSAVPAPLVRSPLWAALCDVPARLLMPGVRTLGRAGPDRREWYGARGLRPVVAAEAVLDGVGLGRLGPLDPPVAFGFGSAPRTPSLVRVTTTVELAGPGR
ncbi:hypothetical protein SCALM49S_02366 [Streptomyces californicus]